MVVLYDMDQVLEAGATLLDLRRRNKDCLLSAVRTIVSLVILTLRILDAGDAHRGVVGIR